MIDGSNNLIITDTDGTKDNDWTISRSGSDLVISNPTEAFSAAPAGGSLSNGNKTLTIGVGAFSGNVQFFGMGGSDKLTVNLATALGKAIVYDGGNGVSDSLAITGGSFGTITNDYATASSGSITTNGGSGSNSIQYTGLEPIDMTGSSATDLVFNLPASASTATLAQVSGTTHRLSSSPVTFEQTDFTTPSGSLQIYRGNAADTLSIGTLSNFSTLSIGTAVTPFASLTFTNTVGFAADQNFTAFVSGSISFPNPTSDISAAGTGAISLTADRNVSMATGASITTVDGNIELSANWTTTTGGNFVGIDLDGATITSNGAGQISLKGRGGDSNSNRYGISVRSNALVQSTSTAINAGGISLDGIGGNGLGNDIGVIVDTATVRSAKGAIEITGQGGNGSGGGNYGVYVRSGGLVESTDSATISLDGVGGNGTGFDVGVYLDGGSVTSADGDVELIGEYGGSFSDGVRIDAGADVSSTGAADIALISDSISLATANAIQGGSNTVSLKPKNSATLIGLGAADTAGTLGLTDIELDRVTAGTLIIGGANSGTITVSADITRAAATAMQLVSGGDVVISGGQVDANGGTLLLDPGASPAAVSVPYTGTDAAASNVSFGSDLAIGITNGATYDQLTVVGSVDLAGVDLVLIGSFVADPGESFTIVSVSGGAISNAFNGLGEGSTIAFNGIDLTLRYTATTVRLVVESSTPPTGADNTVTTDEDVDYTFSESDFGFNDANMQNFVAVIITSLPSAGALELDGNSVALDDRILVTDINANKLKFVPAINAYGASYSSFDFKVEDDGAAGFNVSLVANTMTIDVASVNDAPQGMDHTILGAHEDASYSFAPSEFGFSDPNDAPANDFYSVIITTTPTVGTLLHSGNPVMANDEISVADITLGLLVFVPLANGNGSPYATFTFQVRDDGGLVGVNAADTDPTPRTMTIDVASINDAPHGADNTVETDEDTAYEFAVADFGFSDPHDSPPNAFAGVVLTSLPTNGTLTLSHVPVTVAGTFVSEADIAAGHLRFVPDANDHGVGYATFTFQVRDDGGLVGFGAADTDPTPRTMTIDVASVNDDPDDILLSNQSVAENAGVNAVIGTLSATDPDDPPTPQTFTFTLPSGVDDNDHFNIAPDGVTLRANGSFNFELQSSYLVTVRVEDQDGGFFLKQLTITVTDENDAPTSTGIPDENVLEDAPNSVVDLESYFDDEDLTDTPANLTYTIESNDNPSLFTSVTINGANELVIQYAPNAYGVAHITIRAMDMGGLYVETVLTVTVAPENDPPSFTRGDNQEFTILQTTNAPEFANPWPGTQTISGWATALSAGPNEATTLSGPSNSVSQTVSFEVEVLSNADLFIGTPTVTVDGSLASASLHFTPNPQRFGTAILRVRIVDGLGAFSPWQTIAITIAPEQNSPQPKVRYLDPQLNIVVSGSNTVPSVAVNTATGDFVIVWANVVSTDISFQRFAANGAALGAITPVNAPGGVNTKPAVAMDAAGNFVIAWEFNNEEIVARRFDANGSTLGGQFTLNDTTAGSQTNPALAVNLDGSFLAAWSGPDGSGNGIFARRFDANGVAVDATDLPVNSVVAGSQSNPSVALDAAGNFVVAWQGPDADGSGLFARRYEVESDSFGPEFAVNTTTTANDVSAHVSMDADGDFVIAWVNFDGVDSAIRFQQFAASGLPFGSEITVATAAAYLSSTSAAMDADGDFVVVWDTATGIGGVRHRGDGSLDDSYTVYSTTPANPVELSRVASNGAGDFVVVWQRTDNSEGKIDFQQFKYNESPYDLTYVGDLSLDETSDAFGNATISGTFEAFDNNPDDTFTYSIHADNSGGGFAVHPTSGALSVAIPALIDFESAPIISPTQKAYSVTVRATDAHGLFRDLTVVIEVMDRNETPTAVSLDTNTPATPLDEHSPVGAVVGTLTTSDPDSADDLLSNGGTASFSSHSYILIDDAGGRFMVVGDQIQVADADALEYNDAIDDGMGNRYFEITVRSTDGGGLFHDETIRIYVAAVDETIVNQVRVGDDAPGRSQRSRIEQLEVTFSRVIDLGHPGTNVAAAFTLIRLDNSTNVALTVHWRIEDNGTPGNPNDDYSVATLTFAPQANVFGRSVIDGNYQLTVNGAHLRDSRGIAVDGDGDAAPGGAFTHRFYRLFGDFVTSGEYTMPSVPLSWRTVDGLDTAYFRLTYGTLFGNPAYESAFDYDGDGDIDGFDLAFFRFNFGVNLPVVP